MNKNVEIKIPLVHKKINRYAVNTDSIEAMTPETDKLITGTFVNVECPGQTAKICGKYYKGMDYFCKVLNDNERVNIPLSVARFINERCAYEEHTHILDAQGNPVKGNKKRPRYKFLIESEFAA